MLSKGILLLTVLSVGAVIAAADDDADYYQSDEAPSSATIAQCAVSCPVTTSSAKFGYETGKIYEYRYEGDIKTSVPGRTTEHSSLHVRATAQIEVVSTCEMILRVSEVSLQDSNPTNFESRQHVENAVAFRRGLQAKPLSFAFVDGQIDSICPDSDDETWSLNIKRGILSALQNTMTSLDRASNARETDVSGNCPVKYEVVSGGWGTRTVKKTKDLLGCSNRQAGQTIFQAVQYDAASDIQSMPLMKSTHRCEQQMSNRDRIITKTTCSEQHVFRPFARDSNSGATTEVSYKLEFQSKNDAPSAQRSTMRSRSTLLYDHRLGDEEMADIVRDARSTLTTLCRQTDPDVRPDAPGQFNTLVKQMRKLDASNLQRLMAATKQGMCTKAEKYFRDALPVLGSTGGVVMMRNLITQGKADDAEADRWLASIAFISDPTPDMMKELQSLLTSDFERSALPVSSLINTYSQLYSVADSDEAQQLIKTLEDELKYNCKYEDDSQRSRIIKALKAIGNAGNAERTVPALNRCIANKELPAAMRVAAITAFRRLSCSADRATLVSLMEDKEVDSELRIMAYLAVMQCANDDVINRVRNLLESDEVNQVGSFIWTHLTNLQETACPMKAGIQNLLKDVVLSKTYDLDKRKFSRNIELSGFSEVFNIGALLESNLIWSSQSYIPRTASVNLTIDVFGQSVNLLEVGGRAQGVEALLEGFFAPGSDNSIRQKRAVIRDDILNNIDRRFPKTRDELSLSYYMRVFGNELKSGEISNLDFEGLKNRFNYLNWLIMLAQENRFDVTKNFLFLDSAFTVPTGVGLPLKLSVEGTATVAITASGKVDIGRVFSSPSVFDINGSIRPSAAVEIRGEMGVDARFAKAGLKTVNTLHTSTILDGKIQLQNGVLFNLDLNLPQEKVEIFSAESHVYVTYRGQEREQQGFLRPGAVDMKKCTGQQITYIFGVELCGEVSLAGPFAAKAYLNKKDTYTGFHFEAGYRPSPQEMTDSVRISMSTPGSRVDREITADFRLDRANTQLLMNLKSPWKKVDAEVSLVNSVALKRATFKAKLDDTLEYSVNAEAQISERNNEAKFIPSVRIAYPDSTGSATEITFDGSVVYTKGKKINANLALRNAFQQPVTLEGSVELQEKKGIPKYDVNIRFNSQLVKGSLTGFVSNNQDNGNTWSSRADLVYHYNGRKERIVINHKLRDQSTSNLRSYSTDCSWTSTITPSWNGQVGLELAFSPNSLRTKIEAGFDNMKKITIIQSGSYDFTSSDRKISGTVKFELPYKSWDYEVKLDHVHNADILQSNATVRYSRDQQVTVDVGLKRESDRFLKISGEAFVRAPNLDMSLTHSLIEKAPREYHGVLNVNGIPKLQSAEVKGYYKMLPKHEFSADINVAGWQPLSVKGHLNPNLKNLQARGELTYGNKNFMGDVSWQHRGTGTAFNTNANMAVAYLGRSHSITAEVGRRNQEFTTNVEVKLSESKKFSLNSQVTAALMEPKIQARFEWPGSNFVALTASGKYETKGWYTTTNDLEGTIQFTSSIPNLEQLGATFRHDQSAKAMKSNGEVFWAADKKIVGEFSQDKSKISLDLTTPFEGYRAVKAEAAYTPKGKMVGYTAKVSWDANQMVLAFTGENNSPSVNGKITFTSPFRGFESLSTSLKHVVTGDKYTTTADVTWAKGQQIAVVLNMNHNRNGWSVANDGDVTVQTPFRQFRLTKLTWTHKNDASGWKCRHELEFDRQKYILEVDSSHRLTRANRQLAATASFQSPVKGLENLKFSAEYQHDMRSVKSSGKASVSWGSNRVAYEHEVSYNPNALLLIKGQVTTPFEGFETIAVDMNNRRSGNTFTAANELTISKYGKSTLGGTLSYEGLTVDANLRLTTPCEKLERVALTFRNSKKDDVWTTHGSLEYAAEKSYSMTSRVGWESEKKFEVEIYTPHYYMQSVKFNAGVTGTPRNFRVTSELEHNIFQRDKITVTISADTSDMRRMNAMVAIRTPFESFSNFKVSADHARESAQRCVTTGSYEFNSIRGSLNHEASIRNRLNFNTKTEIEYVTGRKIEMTAALNTESKISASATFKSPFAKVRDLSMTFNHEGQIDNFKNALELSYNRREKINTIVEVTVADGSIRVYSKLTTPFQAVQRAIVEINHVGSPGNYRCDASFDLNNQKVSTNAQLQLERNGVRFNAQLDSPYRLLRQATVSLNHNGDYRSFSNSAELTYDGSTISASSEFNLQGPTGKFSLRTPYQKLRSINLEFAHETRSTRQNVGWSNSASLEVNGQSYTGQTEFSMTPRQVTGKAIVNIPQEYSINFQHRGESIRDFSNSITLKMDDQTVTSTNSFRYTSALIDAKATLETTYPGYNKFEAVFKHEGPVSDFTTKLSITTPLRNFRSFVTELTYTGNPSDFTSRLIVNTPFRAMPRLIVNANHQYTRQSLNSGISITTSGEPISATVAYKKDGSSVEYSGKLQTPYRGYENFEYNEKFSGDYSNFRSSGSLVTPFEGYERFYYELNHAGSWSSFRTSGKYESSAYSTLAFAIDNNSPNAWRISTTVEVEVPAGKITTAFKNDGEPGNFRSGLTVTTPYRGYESFEVNVEHEGGVTSPKSKVTVQTPFRGYKNFQLSGEKSGSAKNLQLKAELTTPIRNWERTAASWSHNVEDSIQLNGQIETSYPGYEKVAGSLTHSQSADNFQTTVSMETSIQRYERQTLTINHSTRRNSIKTTAKLETSVPGYTRFSGNFDYSENRRGKKATISVDTPIRGYERFTTALDINTSDSNIFGGSLQISTPIRGYESLGLTFNHNGDLSQFQTTAQVKTPFSRLPQVDVTLSHRGQLSDFTTGVKVEYNSKSIETEVAFKRAASRYDSRYDGSFKLTSPCPYVRDFSIVANHVRQSDVKTGALEVTHNAEKKVDFDYRYTTSGDQQIEINIRNPYSMSTTLNMDGEDGQAVVNWDTKRSDSQVKFDFGFKNTKTTELTERSIRLKTALPRRTLGFEFGYTLTSDKFTNKGELQWDSDPESDFSYELEASKSAARYMYTYDGKLKVTSGLATMTSAFNHKTNVNRKHATELVIETSERLRLSNEVTMTSSGFTQTFTAQHPRFTQDVVMTTEVTQTGNAKSAKVSVKYERQSFTVEGQVTDDSPSDALKKSGSFRFTHPNSFIDVRVNGDIFNDDERAGGNAELQYQMSRDRSTQRATVSTEVKKVNKEFKFELVTPIDTLRLAATNRFVDSSNDRYGYEVTAQTTQVNLRAVSELNLRDRSLEAKVYYTADDYVQLFGQTLNPLQANFEVSRFVSGEKISDVSASLSLSDERLLVGKASIRPNLWNDIRAYYARADQLYPQELATKYQQWARTMSDDFNLKKQRVQSALVPVANAARAVANDFNAKAKQLNDELNAMYDRNDFYVRDIYLALLRTTEQISANLVELKRAYYRFSVSAQRALADYNRRVQQKMDALYRCLADKWETVAEKWEEIRPKWEPIAEIIRAYFEELGNQIRNHPKVKAMIEKLNSLQLSDFLPPSDWQEKMIEAYKNYKTQIDELLSRPELKEVRDWVIKKVEETLWMYDYLGYRQQVALWIEQARSLTWQTVKVKVIDYVKEMLQLSKNKWTTWDVSRGEYAFQLYIPFDAFDLSFLQRFNLQKYFDYIRNAIARLIPDEEWTLIDTLYSYRPSYDYNNWIPPFKSHASLSGSQHFMTFDHKFYEFAGECSYLLTRDFVDKSFSVIVNYDKTSNGVPTRKSLTVVADGKQIEVMTDARVTVDGARSEMPIRSGNTTVTRTGNAIRVANDRGFSVECDLPHDICSISVSGWYYNKMAGLLGTYDNEPSNDFTTIDGKIADGAETLAYSWTVGQKCQPKNRAIDRPVDEDTKAYEVCSRHFKSSGSSFRSCFRQVNPEPYMQMCINEMPADDDSASDDSACKVAAAYVQECRRHDVTLRMPRSCVRCDLADSSRSYTEGATYQFTADTPAPKMADIVFIVQHAQCNKELMDKVKGLVDDLDKAMKGEGLTNTRYSVIGFGGKSHLSSPHIHTMDGQVFNTANKVAPGLAKFDLESGDNADPMQAIRFASKLAFRAGASKTFVLLPCDKCTESSIRYRDLQRALLSADIRLHVLVQDQIALKSGASVKTAFIFGADHSNVYTRKDVAGDELSGEPDLRRYIRVPKDLCVALTEETDGSFFSARQWIDNRPVIQKRFTDVMVRIFARKALQPDNQMCECVADELGVGYSQCSVDPPRRPLYSYYPDFEIEDPTETTTEVPTKTETEKQTQQPKEATTRPPRTTTLKKVQRPRPVRPTPRKPAAPRKIPVRPQQQQQQQQQQA